MTKLTFAAIVTIVASTAIYTGIIAKAGRDQWDQEIDSEEFNTKSNNEE